MKKAIFQAPAGKWFFKLYDDAGSVVFNSGEIFETQMEAFEACEKKISEYKVGSEEVEETKKKKSK